MSFTYDDEELFGVSEDENEDIERDVQEDTEEEEQDDETQDGDLEEDDEIDQEQEEEELLEILDDEEEEDEEDEDLEDDGYLMRFDENMKNNYILENHHDILQNSYEEIRSLSKVVRDVFGNVVDPLHKTIPILTKYERARVLGIRAKQINNGAEPFIDVENDIIDGYIIAEKELESKKLPYIIVRPLPNGKKEYWPIEELELLDY